MNESWNKFDPGRAEPSPPVLAAATQPWTNTDTHTLYFLSTLPAFPFYFSCIFFLLFLVFAATWPWTNTDIHTPPYILILIFTFSIGFSLDFKSTFAVSPVRFPMKCSFFLLCTSFFVLSL